MKRTFVFWLTGLSGSGKSTIARSFADILTKDGFSVKIMDGDEIREQKHRQLKFTVNDIKKNNQLIAEHCLMEINNYDFILVAVISPLVDSRKNNRLIIGEHYKEIYINISLETAIKRDTKGLYKKALKGEIENFIGISEKTPYEVPLNPELVIDTDNYEIGHCVRLLENYAKNLRGKKGIHDE